MVSILHKLEAQRIYARNHELAKSDPFANYVYKMNQADVTTDGKDGSGAQTHVIDFLQTNLPLSKEWKEAVNAKVDKLLNPIDEFLKTPLTTCSGTAFIAKCSPDAFDASPAEAETNLLATFVARAYEIKVNSGTALNAAQLITKHLISDTAKKYTVALNTASTGSAVKDAVADQATAKALTVVPEIGNVVVDNTGAIQTEGTAEGDTAKKLSTLANSASITDYSKTSGCTDFTAGNIANCAYVIKAGIWNYLSTGKGGTGAEGSGTPEAGIAGAKQIHDYLSKEVKLADKAKSAETSKISEVADSRIFEPFAKVAEVHKDGTTACDTSSKTIKDGKAECKFTDKEIQESKYDADADKNTKIGEAIKTSIDLAGKEYFEGVAGTKVADTVIAKSTGTKGQPGYVPGYENAVGAKVQSNTPALLNTIVKNYVAGVLKADGKVADVDAPSADQQGFYDVYYLASLNLCGIGAGDETGFPTEVTKCKAAYYNYVGAVTTACAAKSETITEACATGFAGSFMTAYKDGFDENGACHLNAISEPQGDYQL